MKKIRLIIPKIIIVVLFFICIYKMLNPKDQQPDKSTVHYSFIEKLKNIEVEQRLSDRRSFVRSMCQVLKLNIPGNDSLHKPNAWEFMINEDYKLIWCNIFKAASSSWMYNFNILAGYTPEFLNQTQEHPIDLARRKYPRPSVEELQQKMQSATSFMITRHPFERLLAAYYQKLVNPSDVIFYRHLALSIVQKYRKKNDPKKQHYPTFNEFIQYIIKIFQNRLRYGKNSNIDMHWIPMTEFCTPCMVDFDYIIRFERIQEEQLFLIEKVHLSHILKPQWRNKMDGYRTNDLIDTEFRTLTKTQIRKLYAIYEYDFLVFNYSIDEYLSLAKNE